jgi:hypothetical protein
VRTTITCSLRNPTPINPIFLTDFYDSGNNKKYSPLIFVPLFLRSLANSFIIESAAHVYAQPKGGYVKVEEILAGIDQEIARLQHARNLLAGDQPRRGRPRGSTSAKKATKAVKTAKPAGRKKRKLSAEGRKRIAEAMRKRWAERKKATAGK